MEQRALLSIDLDISGMAQQAAEGKKRIAELATQMLALKKEGKENTVEYVQLQAEMRNVTAETRQQITTVSQLEKAQTDTSGSIVAMRTNLSLMTKQYNSLSAEERENIEVGVRLKNAIREQSDELKKLEGAVGNTSRNVGNYKDSVLEALQSMLPFGNTLGAIVSQFNSLSENTASATEGINTASDTAAKGGGIFQKFGGLLAGIGIGVGIGLVAEGVTAATAAAQESVKKFQELRKEINLLTGSEGAELDEMAAGISALASTYNKEAKEVLLATNTLSKQMGISQTDALGMIEKGFLSGADASGQLLEQVSEYSTQFKDAGASAEDLMLVLAQSTKEGVFSDKGADVVKEFGLRIREQTKATREALENAFGEDFTQTLFDGINNGSISSVEALKMVSKGLNDTNLTAAQTQLIVADVFAGPGEDAGLDYLKSLQNIGSSLDDVIDTSSVYVQRQMALLDSEQQLAKAQNELSKAFDGGGQSIDVLANDSMTVLYTIVTALIGIFKAIFTPIKEAWNVLSELGEEIGLFSKEGNAAVAIGNILAGVFQALAIPITLGARAMSFIISKFKEFVDSSPDAQRNIAETRAKFTALFDVIRNAPAILAGFVAAFKSAFGDVKTMFDMVFSGDFSGAKTAWANIGKSTAAAYNEAFKKEQGKGETELSVTGNNKSGGSVKTPSAGISPEEKAAREKAAAGRLKAQVKEASDAKKERDRIAKQEKDDAIKAAEELRKVREKLAEDDKTLSVGFDYSAREQALRDAEARELQILKDAFNERRNLLISQGIETQFLEAQFRRDTEDVGFKFGAATAALEQEKELEAIRVKYAALREERVKAGAEARAVDEAEELARQENRAKWEAINTENDFRKRDSEIERKIEENTIKRQFDEEMVAWEQEVSSRRIGIANQFLGAISGVFKQHTILGKAAFMAQKAIAIAEIIVNTQKTIAANTAAASLQALGVSAIPVVGVGMAAAIKAKAAVENTIAKISAGIQIAAIGATAIQGLKTGGVFETQDFGGLVKGPGHGTSDSVNARLSNGESVVNARSTRMFLPLLSYINEAGGGVPFTGSFRGKTAFATGGVFSSVLGNSVSQDVAGNQGIITATIAEAMRNMPRQVLVIEEVQSAINDKEYIQSVQNQ